ncbi:hypothetical protein ACMD2_01462 [Ananas comosus]|uniref:Uncharacterized protein n=1 Tax=Ananas comosus TaxID=4615 RepID=A0A199VC18_ANACO|nr:hypothetical protein ACMD2_01462 [Ananas comosus]
MGTKGILSGLYPTFLRLQTNNVYLVAAANHLLHSKSESKQGVLTSLTILRDTSFKTTSGGINDKDGTVGLGGSGNHVLDEVPMPGRVNDCTVVLGGLEFPQSNINGDTTLPLSLELVKDPRILE